MKVFVLCGGEGTRLRPHTHRIPKPMLKVGDKPILQYVLENLKTNGLTDLILAVGYKREQIMDYFGDGSRFGVKIEYLIERTPQNTAGAILPYKGKLQEPFLVVMGDHVSDVPLRQLLDFHRQQKTIATIALHQHPTKIDFGVVRMQEGQGDGFIQEFIEKPVFEHLVSIGMYVFEPGIFGFIGPGEDFAKNVFPRLISSGKPIAGCVLQGRWDDVGRVADYERLNEEYRRKATGK